MIFQYQRRRFCVFALAIMSLSFAHCASGQDESTPAEGAFRSSPVTVVDRHQYRVGELIPDQAVTSIDDNSTLLKEYAGDGVLVVAIRDVGCPLCKTYGSRLAEIEDQYLDQGVRFLFLNPSEIDTQIDMGRDVQTYGLSGLYVADVDSSLVQILGATRTTDVFVLDQAMTLRYRGAIDDQYGIGYTLEYPRQTFLTDALDAILHGDRVEVLATEAPGCVLNHVGDEEETGGEFFESPTYHNRISRIVQQNCGACHRSGGVAPFALETFKQVKGRRGMIKYVLENNIMPPWHANAGSHAFTNDRSLSSRDIAALNNWLDNGTPEGNPEDAPVQMTWKSEWEIGKPDYVVSIPRPVHVTAKGSVRYQYQYVQTNFSEDKWITAMEIRPTQPEVVHHVLAFLEKPPQKGESRRDVRQRWQGGLNGYFAGLVPGQSTTIYPEGMSKRLPAGTWIKFQLHYTPNGVAVDDQTEIGFIFADGPPEHEIRTASAHTERINIPPGESNYSIQAETRFSHPATVLSFAPHMHIRGKAFRYEFIFPDGSTDVVLDIPRFDFNWQTRYKLREPISVPAGTVLRCTAWYDNSPENPANPDPSALVEFGEQTWEEMMIGYFEYWRAR